MCPLQVDKEVDLTWKSTWRSRPVACSGVILSILYRHAEAVRQTEANWRLLSEGFSFLDISAYQSAIFPDEKWSRSHYFLSSSSRRDRLITVSPGLAWSGTFWLVQTVVSYSDFMVTSEKKNCYLLAIDSHVHSFLEPKLMIKIAKFRYSVNTQKQNG